MNILRQHVAAQDSRKTIMLTLLGVAFMLLVAYVYMVNRAVRNAVAYEDMKKEIVTLRSEVAELEMQQIKLKQTVTLGVARSLGYVDVVAPGFVSVNAPKLTLKR